MVKPAAHEIGHFSVHIPHVLKQLSMAVRRWVSEIFHKCKALADRENKDISPKWRILLKLNLFSFRDKHSPFTH